MKTPIIVAFSVLSAVVVLASTALSQTAQEIQGPAPVVPLKEQPPAKLVVDDPLPDQLARGLIVIQYRTENLRIVPVFGPNALDVSPRIGHLHVTVDDAPWHWADASNEPLIIQGLPPGSHQVLVELADPTHKVITSKTISFKIPERKDSSHH